jgi:hypothetical protein
LRLTLCGIPAGRGAAHAPIPSTHSRASVSLAYQPEAPKRQTPPASAHGGPRACLLSRPSPAKIGDCPPPVRTNSILVEDACQENKSCRVGLAPPLPLHGRCGLHSASCPGLPGARSRREPVGCASHTVWLGWQKERTDPDSAASGGSWDPKRDGSRLGTLFRLGATGSRGAAHAPIPSAPSPASASLAYQPEAVKRQTPPASAHGGPRACLLSRPSPARDDDCPPPVPRLRPAAGSR